MTMTRSYGQMLNEPQFTTLRGLREKIEEEPLAEERSIKVEDEGLFGKRTWFQPEDMKAIVTEGTEDVHAVVSDQYELVQHKEAMQPVFDALADLGIPIEGSVYHYANRDDTLDHSQLNVAIRFQDDDYHFEGQGYRMGIGILVKNSYDASASLGVETHGINNVCSNGNFWGKALGEVSAKHLGEGPEEAMEEIEDFILGLASKIDELQHFFVDAVETRIEPQDCKPMLTAIGLPETHVDKILRGLVSERFLTEEQLDRPHQRCVQDLIDGMTYFYTHEYDRSLRAAERHMRKAVRLLRDDETVLIEEGTEILEGEHEEETNDLDVLVST